MSGVRRGVSGVGGVRGWDIPCICEVPVFPEPLNPEIRLSDGAAPPLVIEDFNHDVSMSPVGNTCSRRGG